MKTRLLFAQATCFILLLTGNIIAQPLDSIWQFHYGGTEDDQAYFAIENDDGEFIVVGKTKSYSNGGYDAYILKLNADGVPIWEKSYGGPYEEQIVSVCPALNGGYVVTGYVLSDVWLLWLNEDGDSVGSVIYGGPSADQGLFITNTTDQGYIISASYGGGFNIGDQVWLMKLDYSGDTVWTRKYGGPSQDYGVKVIETSDGGYLIAGRTYVTAVPEDSDPWAIKTDADGDTIWTRKYGGNDEDNFNCVIETSDGYIFGGITRSFGPGIYSVYAVRTNDSGDTIWTRTFGGDGINLCYDISETEEGNYILTGCSSSFGTYYDTYLVEIDPNGNLVWEATYGIPDGSEVVYGSSPTSDRGIIVAGRTNFFTGWKDEVFVQKLGEAGSEIIGNSLSAGGWLQVIPNPVQSSARVLVNNPGMEEVTLILYNSLGTRLKTLIDGKKMAGLQEVSFDKEGLPPGIYYLKMSAGSNQVTIKFLISR